jgi:tetratricopeptide (TPR) repeat protein
MKMVAPIASLVLSLGLLGCASHSEQVTEQEKANASAVNAKPQVLSANTHFAAGQLAESQNRPDVAVTQYKEAIKIDPKFAMAFYRMGVIYTTFKQFDDAVEAWQAYLKVTGNNATAYNDLGFCYEQAGNRDAATDAYQKGIATDKNNIACRTNYGLLLARENHAEQAIAIWQPVLAQAEIHYNLASVYEQNGNKREARVEYQKAIDADPTLSEAKQRLAALQVEE